MSHYVVTTLVNGNSSSRIWDARRPLPLGHPVHWMIETTSKGVRVRHLSGATGRIENAETREVAFDAMKNGTEIKLPKFSLRIKPVATMPAAYEHKSGKTLKIFACAGNWVMDSLTLESSYSAKVHGRTVFTLAKAGDQYQLKSEADDVKLDRQAVAFGETVAVGASQLPELSIHWGSYQWRFGLADSPTLTATKKSADDDSRAFWRAIQLSLVGFGALLALSWIWPKPAPKEELVPEQFTKLVMMKPKASAASASAPAQAATAQKVQKTAVVQAFRAQALQNSMSALLKGGMTKLLQDSTMIAGAGSAANVGKLFDAKNSALRATSPNAGLTEGKNVAVAALGGAAATDGKSAGYGKGNKAGVKGQGESFVSMDIAGADVQEGLTKDEVGEVIHRHLSEVRYCYESAMLRTPDIEGKLIVDFVIGGNGMVKSSEVKTSTLPDPRLDDCVIRRLVTWKFPNPKGGVDVAVSYPFIFKTLGR